MSQQEKQDEKIARLSEMERAGSPSAAGAADIEQALARIKQDQLIWVCARNIRMAAFENEGR